MNPRWWRPIKWWWHGVQDRIAWRWYKWRHPRCTISRECLLDDGHKGDCDEQPYD